MIRYSILFIFSLLNPAMHAQRIRIPTGCLGLPLFQAGDAMGNFSFERFNQIKSASWQIRFGLSGKSADSDAKKEIFHNSVIANMGDSVKDIETGAGFRFMTSNAHAF